MLKLKNFLKRIWGKIKGFIKKHKEEIDQMKGVVLGAGVMAVIHYVNDTIFVRDVGMFGSMIHNNPDGPAEGIREVVKHPKFPKKGAFVLMPEPGGLFELGLTKRAFKI